MVVTREVEVFNIRDDLFVGPPCVEDAVFEVNLIRGVDACG